MPTRRRRDLTVALIALLDDPKRLRQTPASPTTGVHLLQTVNLKSLLIASHKESLANPQDRSQAVHTGGLPFSGGGSSGARFDTALDQIKVDQDGDGAADQVFAMNEVSKANQLSSQDFLWL